VPERKVDILNITYNIYKNKSKKRLDYLFLGSSFCAKQ